MKSRKQGNIKYKRFDVQRKTGKKISRLIYWSIYH